MFKITHTYICTIMYCLTNFQPSKEPQFMPIIQKSCITNDTVSSFIV